MTGKKKKALTPDQLARSEKAKAAYAARQKAKEEAPTEEPAEAPKANVAPQVTDAVSEIGKQKDPEAAIKMANDLANLDTSAMPKIPQAAEGDDVIIIHFVENGHVALGKSWFIGEELSVQRGGEIFQRTVDRLGRSWLDMTEEDQLSAYGKVIFRLGKWPHKKLDSLVTEDDYLKAISEGDAETVKKYEKQKRSNAGPPARTPPTRAIV